MKEKKDYLKVDLEKLKKAKNDKEKNFIERLAFVEYWANYVKTHSDEEWSEQQNVVINSQLGKACAMLRLNEGI